MLCFSITVIFLCLVDMSMEFSEHAVMFAVTNIELETIVFNIALSYHSSTMDSACVSYVGIH